MKLTTHELDLFRHNHIYLREKGSTASLGLHRDCRQWSRAILTVPDENANRVLVRGEREYNGNDRKSDPVFL